MALKDEIERPIRACHFTEFVDKPQTANREERPQQQNPEKVRDVLTTIGGYHLAGESRSARGNYAKNAKTPPPTQV